MTKAQRLSLIKRAWEKRFPKSKFSSKIEKRDKLVNKIIELVDKMIAPGYLKIELIDKINELERLAQKPKT